jgi:hypothetical protein
VVFLDLARLGKARPPNLDSQYRPAGNICQAKIAGGK